LVGPVDALAPDSDDPFSGVPSWSIVFLARDFDVFTATPNNPSPDSPVDAFAAGCAAVPAVPVVFFAWDLGVFPATRDDPSPDGPADAITAGRADPIAGEPGLSAVFCAPPGWW
jgi:hypothetical protein